MNLIARLLQGPLRADDYAEVSVSRTSLKRRISLLREKGFEIETLSLANGRRNPKAEYRLVAGECPCCGRAVA